MSRNVVWLTAIAISNATTIGFCLFIHFQSEQQKIAYVDSFAALFCTLSVMGETYRDVRSLCEIKSSDLSNGAIEYLFAAHNGNEVDIVVYLNKSDLKAEIISVK